MIFRLSRRRTCRSGSQLIKAKAQDHESRAFLFITYRQQSACSFYLFVLIDLVFNPDSLCYTGSNNGQTDNHCSHNLNLSF